MSSSESCASGKCVSKPPIKSIKLISHIKQEPGEEAEELLQREFQRSFSSDSIQILSGSFSDIRPIGERGPLATSTPRQPLRSEKYEDLTDDEDNETDKQKEEENGDLNATFNEQEDLLNERISSDQFIQEVIQFEIRKKNFLTSKHRKRREMEVKLKKYMKKIQKVEAAIDELDSVIRRLS